MSLRKRLAPVATMALLLLGVLIPLSGPAASAASAPSSPSAIRWVTLAANRWSPAVGGAWQIQFSGTQNTSVNVPTYDLDGFDTPAATISALRASGRHAICYVSAGSWEDWRPDAAAYPRGVLGKSNGWPGERWLDIRAISALKPVIDKRLAMCRSKGFQAVDYDNVDGYTHNTGFPLTSANQVAFNRWIAAEAHAYGMSVGLKNDLEQIPALVGNYDFAINEQCHEYDECTALRPFVQAGKAVLQIEYAGNRATFCPLSRGSSLSTVIKSMNLSAWRKSC